MGLLNPDAALMLAHAISPRNRFVGGLLQMTREDAERAERAKTTELQRGLLSAQIDETRAQATARQQAVDQARRKQDALPSLFPGGGGAAGAPGGAMPQGGGGQPFTQIDYMRALQAGYSPDEITKLAGLQELGRPKATRQMEVDDGRGNKRIALVDDFGREVAGFAGYTAPVQVNQGDRVSFVRPEPGVSLGVNMSPGEKASNAVAWANNAATIRGQNLTDARSREANAVSREAQQTQIINDPVQGPMLVNKGTGLARPAVGADGKPIQGEAAYKAQRGASEVLDLIAQAERIIPKATGSYGGAAVDQGARVLGLSPDGADAIAQLRALEGALIAKMPRMEGPQSNLDQQLYRQAIGAIGDPTIPASQKQAALKTLKSIQSKYAAPSSGGASGGWSIQKVQ